MNVIFDAFSYFCVQTFTRLPAKIPICLEETGLTGWPTLQSGSKSTINSARKKKRKNHHNERKQNGEARTQRNEKIKKEEKKEKIVSRTMFARDVFHFFCVARGESARLYNLTFSRLTLLSVGLIQDLFTLSESTIALTLIAWLHQLQNSPLSNTTSPIPQLTIQTDHLNS